MRIRGAGIAHLLAARRTVREGIAEIAQRDVFIRRPVKRPCTAPIAAGHLSAFSDLHPGVLELNELLLTLVDQTGNAAINISLFTEKCKTCSALKSSSFRRRRVKLSRRDESIRSRRKQVFHPVLSSAE